MGEGRGNAFIEFLKRGRKEIVPNAFGTGNSRKDPGTSEETIPEGQTGATCESLWMKMIGKPYSGKPNVRFDEGELEIEPLATTPALYSTESDTRNNWAEVYSGRINFCYLSSIFSLPKMFGFLFQICIGGGEEHFIDYRNKEKEVRLGKSESELWGRLPLFALRLKPFIKP